MLTLFENRAAHRLFATAIRLLASVAIGGAIIIWMAGLAIAQDGNLKGSDAGAAKRGSFSLVDHTGRAVTEEDFLGRFMLVFFGYTRCPDICPTDLQIMSSALELLGQDEIMVQPLFVTVDPERDTPDVLADYVGLFQPRLIGLTGTLERIGHNLGTVGSAESIFA